MPFNNVECLINWFDGLDLCKYSVNIHLNIWAYELQHFAEERAIIGKRVNPLILVLVKCNCNLYFQSEHFHDLIGDRFPAFQKLLASK